MTTAKKRKKKKASLGRVPRVSWEKRISKRVAASNAIGNVTRAVKAGKCSRARKILEDYSFTRATASVSYATLARLYAKVENCR